MDNKYNYKEFQYTMMIVTFPFTARKMFKYGYFSGPHFPVLGLNTGKYGPEKTPCLDTFHAVFGVMFYIPFSRKSNIRVRAKLTKFYCAFEKLLLSSRFLSSVQVPLLLYRKNPSSAY